MYYPLTIEDWENEITDIKNQLNVANNRIGELLNDVEKLEYEVENQYLPLLKKWADCFSGNCSNPLKDLKELIKETRDIIG